MIVETLDDPENKQIKEDALTLGMVEMSVSSSLRVLADMMTMDEYIAVLIKCRSLHSSILAMIASAGAQDLAQFNLMSNQVKKEMAFINEMMEKTKKIVEKHEKQKREAAH
jgi:hypothetical protein